MAHGNDQLGAAALSHSCALASYNVPHTAQVKHKIEWFNKIHDTL